MQLHLELAETPSRLVIQPGLSNEAFEKLCAANSLLHLERTKEGTIVVNPPAAWGTGKANSELLRQLTTWWYTHRRGEVADSSAGIFLPDGSALSPDAAYITAEQEATLDEEDDEHFLDLVPAFIIELRSKTDTLTSLQEKMDTWIANGVQLGWLVDPSDRSVWIYEPGRPPRQEKGLKLEGSGPVAGFVLDLANVWNRYKRR
jgi:Uma2 family endonuclease